jgi:nitrous oxide reductase
MLATERLIEIELLCSGNAHHLEVVESDGEYLKVVIFFNDGSNLRVAELVILTKRSSLSNKSCLPC